MAEREYLKKLGRDIKRATERYQKEDSTWQAFDIALITLCGSLENRVIRTVLPKVVAVDRLYKADLIRYLPKPDAGGPDYRPGYYLTVARAITQIKLDNRLAELATAGDRLSTDTAEIVVAIHAVVAQAVGQVVGRNGDVFAAKYLHFCRQDYFPILDKWAKQTVGRILAKTNNGGKHIITERLGYDDPDRTDYDQFCRAVLAVQTTLSQAGVGDFTLPEIDRYLYWYGR